ncbi:MAG: SurA N-terminal domain-containing protein [Acidobacteria bacterium]|nr:SurA N-terminal domain-containing protein [Acidobacteriota bacterium]
MLPIRRITLALAAGVLFFAAGCNRAGHDVVARVNGKNITRAELEKYYKLQVRAESQQQPQQEPDPVQADSTRLNVLDQLIQRDILLQQAEKDGVLATDDEVNEKLTGLRSPYTAEEFQKMLQQRGITEDDERYEIRINLTQQKLINKQVNSKINISDSDIKAYYNAHKPEFNLIETQYQVAHIFVPIGMVPQGAGDKPHSQPEALAKAQMVYNRLQSGEAFDSLAQRYSEDPSTRNTGGEIGAPMPESALARSDPAIREAVLKLKPGQFSAPVLTRQPLPGYEIVRLISREPAGQHELSDPEVQQFIRERLRTTREQLLTAAYSEVVRNQSKVENYFAEEVLKRFVGK